MVPDRCGSNDLAPAPLSAARNARRFGGSQIHFWYELFFGDSRAQPELFPRVDEAREECSTLRLRRARTRSFIFCRVFEETTASNAAIARMSIRSLKQRVEFAMRVVIVELERTTNRPHHDAALPTSEDTLWQELVACLLGSVVPFPVAQAFAEHLGGAGLLKRGQHRFQTQAYERDLAEELSTPIPVNNGTRFSNQRYRFPRLRASHIRRTAEAVFGSGGSLTELLENASDERLARQRLVASAVGIGPKQASLFLRKIGH